VSETMKKLDLSWSKLKGGTTDRALSITGKKTGLMGRRIDKILNCTWNFTASSSNSHTVENYEI